MQVSLPDQTFMDAYPVLTRNKTQHSNSFAVPAGNYLFREGDPVSRLYRVTSGVFRLTRLTECGRRQVIAFAFPGDILGFPCEGHTHSDCDALTNAQVSSFSAKNLDDAKTHPELHQALLDAALREISEMQDHFMMLAKKSAIERVATFLSSLAVRIGEPLGEQTIFKIVMPRADIADYIGLTTETVCRSLTQLRKCGVIKIDNIQSVVVLKPQALHALAEGDDNKCC